jgi:hypothetical protein
MRLGILSSNFQTNLHQELEYSKLASNRMRLNIARKTAESKNIEVLPLNFYNELKYVDCLLIGKYVHKSGANKFIDDDGSRMIKWLKYIEYVKTKGSKIVLDYTDHLIITSDIRSEFYKKAINFSDIVITPSEMMKINILKYFPGNIEIIEDPIEVQIEPLKNKNFEKLDALWFGHPTNLNYLLRILTKLNELTSLTIVTSKLSQQEEILIRQINKSILIKFYEWDKNFYAKYNLKCNICLLPSDIMDSKKNGVSNNRLITALALGLLPVVSPVESYKQFKNYYLDISNINTANEYILEKIYGNIMKDRNEIISSYTPQLIGAKWSKILFGTN